jgi:S1-C subfamily serine protease
VSARARVAAVLGGLIAAAVAPAGLLLARDDADPAARASRPLVVSVAVARGGAPELATGFAAGEGRVVTVAHVLDGAGPVTVRLPGGVRRAARVVVADRRLDLAVLAVRGLRAPPLLAGRGEDGTARLLAAGRSLPARVRRHVTADVRGASGGEGVRRPALVLAASVRAGDSGAPVVDARGRVIGVLFARSNGRAGIAYAVDGAVLAPLLRATAHRPAPR